MIIYNLAFSGIAAISALALSFRSLRRTLPDGLQGNTPRQSMQSSPGDSSCSQSGKVLGQDDPSCQPLVVCDLWLHPRMDIIYALLLVGIGWVRVYAFCGDNVSSVRGRQHMPYQSTRHTPTNAPGQLSLKLLTPHPNHANIRYVLVAQQQRFQLGRSDLQSFVLDQFLFPIDDAEDAFRGDGNDVAGLVPSVRGQGVLGSDWIP